MTGPKRAVEGISGVCLSCILLFRLLMSDLSWCACPINVGLVGTEYSNHYSVVIIDMTVGTEMKPCSKAFA